MHLQNENIRKTIHLIDIKNITKLHHFQVENFNEPFIPSENHFKTFI